MPGVGKTAQLSEAHSRLLQREIDRKKHVNGNGIRRRTDSGPAPLSYSQRRMWLLQQSNPESPFYNMMRVLRIEGFLDEDALERALEEILLRHAVLRTTFELNDGEPLQVVHPPRPFVLEVETSPGEAECEKRV